MDESVVALSPLGWAVLVVVVGPLVVAAIVLVAAVGALVGIVAALVWAVREWQAARERRRVLDEATVS